jgi:hypothetical protein
MTYDDKSDIVMLSSGRTFYSFGCDFTPQEEGIGYGTDGGVATDDWTTEERNEVADHMIQRWTEWRERRI